MKPKIYPIEFFLLLIILVTSTTISTSKSSENVVKKSVYDNPGGSEANFDVELRAILTNCKSQIATHQESKSELHEVDEEFENPDIMHCIKKLQVTLKIHNQGATLTNNQFVVIEHVIDASTGEKVSLANPYVIVMKQTPVSQLYGLKYKFVVNAEAKEEVLNKMRGSFKGCDDYSQTPTCGNIQYSGSPISYSQGFCCSCDEQKNQRRQPRNPRGYNESSYLNIHDFIYSQLKFENDESFDSNEPWDRYKRSEKSNIHTSEVKSDVSGAPVLKRRIHDEHPGNNDFTGHRQLRGGQDCDDKWTPSRVDPRSYHDSAHCLRFSDLWYSVYQLSSPVLEHSTSLKVFQKRDRGDGAFCWVDLCHGHTINVGTFRTKHKEKDASISATYDEDNDAYQFDMNPDSKLILIPQTTPGKPNASSPELEGGPGEFLVVDKDDVKPTGDECDTIGVGYIAFFNQKNRCSKPKNTCLNNQPRQLWQRDKKAAEAGLRGHYFLKNYAKVPENALKLTKEGNVKYLSLYYEKPHLSLLSLDIKADDNFVYSRASRAKITEVYIDSTSEVTTLITVKIYNNGLISTTFRPRVTDCPLEIPAEWSNLEGAATLIPPQKQYTYVMKLFGSLPIGEFACSVEALNDKNEILAVRRFLIVKKDRCICAWHCLCACLEKTGLGCSPMLLESYRAAGFAGSMPLTTNMVQKSAMEKTLFGVFYFFLLLIMILLMLGFCKAFVGFCISTTVGVWGLDLVIGLQKLAAYYEPELRYRPVVYDNLNWPVHPDTKKRSVRIVEDRLEFCLNLLFFFMFPFALCWFLCSKFCCFWCFKEIIVNDQISEILECKDCPTKVEEKRRIEFESEYEDDCFDFLEESSGS